MSTVGYTVNPLKIQQASFAAEQTKVATSALFRISHEDSKHIAIQITASAVTGTVSAFLETSIDGGATWSEAGTVAIGNTDPKLIEYYYEAESYVPLYPLARISITTAAASTVTVESILATRRL